MSEQPRRGLLDTSAIIDFQAIPREVLPEQLAVSAPTLGELAAGPHIADDPQVGARRQERLQWVEARFETLPFDVDAARAYGRLYAAVRAAGRQPRRRVVDIQIAAVAVANNLPLITRNARDLVGLESLLRIIAV